LYQSIPDNPEFIALDPSGNLYISDYFNNVIRKVDAATGIISTVVGTTSGYSGDGGPAIDAQLYTPTGLAFDSAGNLYFGDQNGNALRKVTASTGIISTVAGNGVAGYSGDGGPARNARLNFVQGLTVDRYGNLYIADQQNARIRKITSATQIITTVAGASFGTGPATGGPALETVLGAPYGIAVDPSENFYFSDLDDPQIRKVIAGGLAQSTVYLTAPGLNLLVNQPFDLTAQVTGQVSSPVPTGTVTFYSVSNQQTELAKVTLDASGIATYPLYLTAVGSYAYSATYSGDKNYYPSVGPTLGLSMVPKKAAPPTFGPAAGTYTHNLQVQIYESIPNLTVYYTTDGTTPSYAYGTQYKGAVPITANTTIKAIAVDLTPSRQYADSAVAASSYVINLPQEAPLPQGEWAWESGASTSGGGCRYTGGAFGVYGILGVPAPNNVPGGRAPGAHWTDHNGNFWMFGGATATPGNCNDTNDLWMFNPTTKEWTWMSGSDTYPYPPPSGVYGTKGKFGPANVPGSRGAAVSWTDKVGNLWLFGGQGNDSTGKFGTLNDLWEFNPSTRQWAWIAGSNSVNQSGSYGTLHVANSGNIPGSRWGAAGWTDLKGNFWMFGGYAYDSAGKEGDINDLWEFNPSTREWAWMGGGRLINQQGMYGTHDAASPANIPGARDSGMAWVDELGKFWFFGGEGLGATATLGWFNDLWMFNPSDLNWTWAMGSADGGTYNPGRPGQGGVYDNLGVPDPGNTPGSRSGSATFTDAHGNLWLSGGTGFDSAGNYGDLDDLWEFDRAKWLWAWMGGHELVPGVTAGPNYGPYRVPSPLTEPGPRSGAAGWTDESGNPWLFGGAYSPVDTPSVVLLNDLFEYQLP
jgi:N-acetylneuraminic acid mutarotase